MDILKTVSNLELNKILAFLSERAVMEENKAAALETLPVFKRKEIIYRLTLVNSAKSMLERYGTPYFYNMQGIKELLTLAQSGSVLGIPEILEIGKLVKCAKSLSIYKKKLETDDSLEEFFVLIKEFRQIDGEIDRCIISETEIADEASPELSSIRKKIKQNENKIRDILEKFIRNGETSKYLQDSLITIRNGRFVIPVKAEHSGQISGIVHDTSASKATNFIEPMGVVVLNNDIRELLLAEQDEIHKILKELSSVIGLYKEELEITYDALLRLDFVFAKARLALDFNCVLPRISENSRTEFFGARHPLIPANVVVPIDISIGGENKSLVITGPNTGGKTVAIKTLGLLLSMLYCGLLIPVSERSSAAVYDNIYVDIGDEQSIEQNLSTFSSHIKNIALILKEAGQNCLVLLDELGSGTDPVEGSALAIAVLEELKQNGVFTLATTHYPELKHYALETEGVENASLEFNLETLKPSYRIIMGTPGRSNAFIISESYGIDKRIIENARQKIDSAKQSFENVVSRLEETRLSYEQEKEKLENEIKTAEKNRIEFEEKNNRLKTEYDKQLELASKEAGKLVSRAKSSIDKILDELETIKKIEDKSERDQKLAAAKNNLRKRLKSLDDEINPVVEEDFESDYAPPRAFRAGDSVYAVNVSKKGVISDIKKDSANILFGSVKMFIALKYLRLLEENGKVKAAQSSTRVQANRDIKSEIDLRGQNIDEAVMELDRYIDSAYMSGINLLYIIHGKGTGVLRSGIQRYLKTNKFVKSFRAGVYGEGDTGVTVAEIKR